MSQLAMKSQNVSSMVTFSHDLPFWSPTFSS